MGLNLNMGVSIVLLGLSVGFPLMELSETAEQTQFLPLPISMSVAVEAAEAATPGQAIHAQLEIAEGRPVYEIYMLGIDLSLSKVQIDAQDGQVTVGVGEKQELTKREQMVQPDQGGPI
ncbi:MAG: PepSY domain-containing protein [Nitrospirae bacterium]|nr:PepSY domain-containing protein [Nitrospirota bacterium]